MTIAETIIMLVKGWAIIGLAVSALFIFWGIDRVDGAAKDAYAFRPLLIPGIVVIWPMVLWRWWQLEKSRKYGCAPHGGGE